MSAALLAGVDAWALGLGRLNIQSALGEALRAEIEITSLSEEEAGNLNVKVASVNTLNRKGKSTSTRRSGRAGSRPDRKRAIVTLAEGDSIDLFKD